MKITLQILGLAYLLIYSFSIRAQWSMDPSVNNQVCDIDSYQTNQILLTDDAGGVIIVWQDGRSGSLQLYAQHLDAAGYKTWPEAGVPISTATSWGQYLWNAKVVKDGEGGAIIVWSDERNMQESQDFQADVYAQKIDAAGEIQWTINGNVICDAPGLQRDFSVIEDGAGGAFIVWDDLRSAISNIYAQHIDHDGITQWLANGIPVSNDNVNPNTLPTLVTDGNGGALIFWQNGTIAGTRYQKVQRISAMGTTQLQDGGVNAVMLGFNDFYLMPEIVSDGSGGAILCWYESAIGKKEKLLAQRINSSGIKVWQGNTISVYDGSRGYTIPEMISDNNGGAIIIWQHFSEVYGKTLWSQHINNAGQLLWPVTGLALMQSAGGFYRYQLTTDGDNGAIVAATVGSEADIFVQKVSGSGLVQWNAKGIALTNAVNYQYSPNIISNGNGEALVFWQDSRQDLLKIYGAITNNELYLPVTLISFDAALKENQTILSWVTADEVNNKGFDIERSADGKHFDKIAFVNPYSSGSDTTQNYQYTDRAPLSGTNYYRLKQLDHDGKFAYSKMVNVNLPGTSHISVYPNPTIGDLFIETERVSGRIQITDMLGRIVLERRMVEPRTHINVKDLSPGMYIIKGGALSQVFVKQ